MSQHDYVIANQSFPNTRTDLNNAFQALASTNVGTTAPGVTAGTTAYAGQIWIDSTTATAWQPKIYDGAAWINLPFYINTSTNDANLTTVEVTAVESDPQAVALAIALG